MESWNPREIFFAHRLHEFVALCRGRGQAWFESTAAAQNSAFSRYIGHELGWRTRAGSESIRALVTHPLPRFMVLGEKDGPFAEDAQYVLDALAA